LCPDEKKEKKKKKKMDVTLDAAQQSVVSEKAGFFETHHEL
jgi:hypothetical protein